MSKTSKSYYARVLGTFWRHPRTAGLSLAACGAWVRCLSWCADHRTDGAVPRGVVPMVLGGREDRRAMAELVAAGLLEETESALQVRDWSQHNITKEKHEEKLAEVNARVAKHRGNKQEAPSVTPPVTRYTERTERVRTSLPSDQDQDQDQDQRSTSVSDARAPEPETRPRSIEPVRQAIVASYRKRGLAVPGPIAALTPDYETHSKLVGLDAERLPSMLEAFFGDASMASKGFPISWFLANPNQWARPTTATPPGGMPTDLDDLERLALTRAEEGRPWAAASKLESAWHRVAVRHPSLIATRKHPGYTQPASRPAA